MKSLGWALLASALAAACGNDSGVGANDPDAQSGDACTGLCSDAPPFGGACEAQGPQCANCIDDDGDGQIDGHDVNCSGPLDDDEATFGTGIPGDNVDAVKQDCFFDGNSGGGNDGCDIHVCCLLGATSAADCPIGANRYDPAACPPPLGTRPLSQQCIETCGAVTPPGCDCFGCCTVCDPDNPSSCFDVATNPATSPECTADVVDDPSKCLRCTKVDGCGSETCQGEPCVDGACGAQQYCSNGCCIGVIL